MPTLRCCPRTTAFGYYDGNLVGAVERVDRSSARSAGACAAATPVEDPRAAPSCSRAARSSGRSRTRTTTCPARCSRAPRARTSSATRVRPGSRAVVFTNNDSAYATRWRCTAQASRSAPIVDARPRRALNGALPAQARAAGLAVLAGSAIVGAHGAQRVTRGRRRAASAAARRAASIAISSACRAAGIPRSISFRRRAASCATTMRSRRSSPIARRCRSRRRVRRTAASILPQALAEGHAAGAAAASARGFAAPSLELRAPTSTHRRRCCRYGRCPRAARATSASSICRTTSPSTTSRSPRAKLPVGRASEALHDARHGHRSGQDQQHHRPRADGASCSTCRSRRSARRRSGRRTRR